MELLGSPSVNVNRGVILPPFLSDEATHELMVAYYQRLQAGEGRTEALRQVQLSMLWGQAWRHPFFWASFIQSGDWRKLAP